MGRIFGNPLTAKPDTNHSTNPTKPNSGNPNHTNPTTKYRTRIWDRRLKDCPIFSRDGQLRGPQRGPGIEPQESLVQSPRSQRQDVEIMHK